MPTHDHAATLDLAVRSALEQTVAEIEVVVIGDGVGDDTRAVVDGLRREDPRVRFLDFPKGPNHGEIHRGAAIEETSAEIVCYLCDDDLLLPEHVESMADLLADADLANSQNGCLGADGSWHPYLSDLASPQCRDWLLRPDRNSVSLTGTAHTVAAYRRLPTRLEDDSARPLARPLHVAAVPGPAVGPGGHGGAGHRRAVPVPRRRSGESAARAEAG